MKKLVLMCFALFLAIALWPSQGKSNTGMPTLAGRDFPQDDSTKMAKKSKHKGGSQAEAPHQVSDTIHIDLSDRPKAAPEKATKTANVKESSNTEATSKSTSKASSSSAASTKSATQGSTTVAGNKKGNEVPAASTEGLTEIISLYNSLPLENLPELQKYAGEKKFKDDGDYRKSWVKTEDDNKGYLLLQLPATDRFTKIQLFKTIDGAPVFVVETNDCSPTCSNFIRVYKQKAGAWADVTDEMMPKLDNKFITGKLKQAYKKQYDDLDIYNTKGYDNEDNLQKALLYDISPDAKKIVVKEQYLPLNLYEINWDGKSKFVLKKLGE